MVRWIHVQPDDVPHFVDQQRVGRQLEAFRAMRLQPKRSPDPVDRRPGQPTGRGQTAEAPVGRAARRLFQRAHDHRLICSSLIRRGVPGRGSSVLRAETACATCTPSLPTHAAVWPRGRAPRRTGEDDPGAASWGALRDRCASESSRCRSSAFNVTKVGGRPVRMLTSLEQYAHASIFISLISES